MNDLIAQADPDEPLTQPRGTQPLYPEIANQELPASFHFRPTEPVTVALVGDSVLDNFFWIANPHNDVTNQIHTLVRKYIPNSRAVNLAVDRSTVADILHGIVPRFYFRVARKWYGLGSYPAEQDARVWQLDQVAKLKPTHILLSIGGNDARFAFGPLSTPHDIFNKMQLSGFIPNFRRVLEALVQVQPKTVLVFPYHPMILAAKHGQALSTLFNSVLCLPSSKDMVELMVLVFTEVSKVVVEFGLPVIDLSRTFDPYDKDTYGTTPIEPGEKGGQFLAQLFLRVLVDFDFGAKLSKVYSGIAPHIAVHRLADGSHGYGLDDMGGGLFAYGSELMHHLELCEARAKQRERAV